MIKNNKDNKNIRLIVTKNASALINMSIDKILVNTFKKENEPIFRLYSWEKSFTIGLGQNIEDYKELQKSYKNNYAKRITGGGVLFHGHDISYSLMLPVDDFSSYSVKESYENICQFLLEFYKSLGLNPAFAKDLSIDLSKSNFCQVGFEAYDIIINNKKIGGNAQKRTKNMIFQHGSIPINKIENKIEYGNSLNDFNINLNFEEAKEALIKAFNKTFDVNLKEDTLNIEEKKQLEDILKG